MPRPEAFIVVLRLGWVSRLLARLAVRNALCAALLCWSSSLAAQQVVVNPGVSDPMVAKSTLRAIFGMRMRNWSDGTPIVVFVLRNEDPVHVTFSKEVLNMFPHQLQRAWDRLVYSGTGQAPVVLNSMQEMAERVATTPGAVGYLEQELIDERLRVLTIR